MTRLTPTKYSRLFESITREFTIKIDPSGETSDKPATEEKRTIIIGYRRRKIAIPAQSRAEFLCKFCQKPMFVSAGQIADYHKGTCRKLGRKKRK